MQELTGTEFYYDERLMNSLKTAFVFGGAGIAELVEQLICNSKTGFCHP
jgi:hypothetical protein